jgi:hypothetical protein
VRELQRSFSVGITSVCVCVRERESSEAVLTFELRPSTGPAQHINISSFNSSSLFSKNYKLYQPRYTAILHA